MPSFDNPWAFLCLLALPLLYILRSLKIFRKIAFPLVFSDWKGNSFEWNGTVSRILSAVSRALGVFAYVCIVTAFAEPVFRHQEKVWTSRGADILFVLDTSPSMAARDIGNMSRLEAANLGIHTLVKSNKGAAFGLVAMASEAVAAVPPTSDHELFLRRLDSLNVGGLGEGSAIGIGLSSAVYHLISSNAPKKCIVLITDGENNAGSVHPDTAARLAEQNGITVYTFGIGTQGAVPIEYIDPKTGKVHSGFYESEFDTLPLEKIALATGGRYFGIESTQSLAEALSIVSSKESVVQSFHYKMNEETLYDVFLLAGAVAFALSWIISRLILKEV